eukprot:scaffold263_cov120-Isochrysis_galbana.AAC.11
MARGLPMACGRTMACGLTRACGARCAVVSARPPTCVMRAVTAMPCVLPTQLMGSMPKATLVDPSPSASSVTALPAVATIVWPRAPSRRTDRRASSAVAVWPMPESEPKSPHVSAPHPRSSRAKTCQVSPMAMEMVCRADTAERERRAGPERKRRTKPKAGGRRPKGERAERGWVSRKPSRMIGTRHASSAAEAMYGSTSCRETSRPPKYIPTEPKRPVSVCGSEWWQSASAARIAIEKVDVSVSDSSLHATSTPTVGWTAANARHTSASAGAASSSGLRPIVSERRPSWGVSMMSISAAHDEMRPSAAAVRTRSLPRAAYMAVGTA